jgi:hypothetical protein
MLEQLNIIIAIFIQLAICINDSEQMAGALTPIVKKAILLYRVV